jgi:hypothetical protein
MSTPKKHHYCPASYLGNFTHEMNKKGILWTFHKEPPNKVRKSKPIKEACINAFYRLEVPEGDDPNILEKEFGKIESGALKVIKEILTKGRMPDGKALGELISFTGLLKFNSPDSFRPRCTHIHRSV